LVFNHWSFFRHSSLVIRHFTAGISNAAENPRVVSRIVPFHIGLKTPNCLKIMPKSLPFRKSRRSLVAIFFFSPFGFALLSRHVESDAGFFGGFFVFDCGQCGDNPSTGNQPRGPSAPAFLHHRARREHAGDGEGIS
jgi:hypothetical protein